MDRPNLAAGLACLCGVAVLVGVTGPAGLVDGIGRSLFVCALGLAGSLFLLASTGWTVERDEYVIDCHDGSALGDVAVGIAVSAGLASPPSGVEGVAYAALVVLGAASAALFGVAGLAEKYGVA